MFVYEFMLCLLCVFSVASLQTVIGLFKYTLYFLYIYHVLCLYNTVLCWPAPVNIQVIQEMILKG